MKRATAVALLALGLVMSCAWALRVAEPPPCDPMAWHECPGRFCCRYTEACTLTACEYTGVDTWPEP